MKIDIIKPPQYEGWTTSDIEAVIYLPWKKDIFGEKGHHCPVRLKDGITIDDINKAPLMRQILHLMNLLDQKGEVKLTTKGFLPLAIVKELYELGIRYWYYEKPDYQGKMHQLHSETDNIDVTMVHGIIKELRCVKVRHGKLSLTKTGKQMLAAPPRLLESTLQLLCVGGFVDQYDGYNRFHNFEGITLHGELMLLLLAKYGHEYHSELFYGEKFWKMNPHLIDFEEANPDTSRLSDSAYKCVSLRLIDRTMYRLQDFFYAPHFISSSPFAYFSYSIGAAAITYTKAMGCARNTMLGGSGIVLHC